MLSAAATLASRSTGQQEPGEPDRNGQHREQRTYLHHEDAVSNKPTVSPTTKDFKGTHIRGHRILKGLLPLF